MMIVRVLGALAKPAIAGSVLTASAAGGYLAYNHFGGNTPTAFESVQGHTRLVVSAFSDTHDDIVAVDPGDVSTRTTIARIDHAPGFGVFATLAPDGHALAYTALPANTSRPTTDAPAQAAVVDAHGKATLLADDIDLLIAPVWDPGGDAIVVRKSSSSDDGSTFELIALGRDGTRTTLTTWHSAAVFPIGFTPDGSKLYFATLSAQGSDVYSVAPEGSGETKVAHLSGGITREWALSPDGTQLAYTESISGAHPQLISRRLDLATGAASDALPAGLSQAQFNPTWKDNSSLTVGAIKPDGGGDAVSVAGGATTAITSNSESMDQPISWSPSGSELAVRSVAGKTPFEAGEAHLDVIDDSGARQRVSDSSDVLVVGWIK